jgi:predicted GNAT family acetyltransferase
LYATTNVYLLLVSLLCKYAKGTAFGQIIFLALIKFSMLIQHKQMGPKGIFFIPDEEEGLLAELVYAKKEPSTMIIEHTEVDDELKGQNIGYQLVQMAVEYAKSHQLKIIPLCPFAKAVIDKKPEFKEVLANDE